MDPKFLIYFLLADFFGFVCNFVTLAYIVKNFEIRVHVFTMIFIDALTTAVGCIVAMLLVALQMCDVVERSRTFCSAVHAADYIPFSFGAFSMFLVALTRYVLTKKSARNIKLPPAMISKWLLNSYFAYAACVIGYISVNVALNQPYAMIAEICFDYNHQPRPFPAWKVLTIQSPNVFNFLSLLIDIRLVTFLKRTIVAVAQKPIFRLNPPDASSSLPDLESQIPNLSILRDGRRHLLQLPAAAASSRIVFNNDDRGNRSLHQLFNLSTFFDASERTEAKNDANDVNKIPVRATLLSSIIVFPYLVVYGLSYCLNMTDYNRAVMNRLALTICNALRCPLTVLVSYKSNKPNKTDDNRTINQNLDAHSMFSEDRF